MNIPDDLAKTIIEASRCRLQGTSIPEDQMVIRELELRYCQERDELTGAYVQRVLVTDIFDFVWRNRDALQTKEYLCIDIDNLMAINDFHGFGEGDRIVADVASYLGARFPSSKLYHYRGDKFVVELAEPFVGLNPPYPHPLKFALVNVSIRRGIEKHFKIIDGIILALDQAMLKSSSEGFAVTYNHVTQDAL